jgi:hypothetical protein
VIHLGSSRLPILGANTVYTALRRGLQQRDLGVPLGELGLEPAEAACQLEDGLIFLPDEGPELGDRRGGQVRISCPVSFRICPDATGKRPDPIQRRMVRSVTPDRAPAVATVTKRSEVDMSANLGQGRQPRQHLP